MNPIVTVVAKITSALPGVVSFRALCEVATAALREVYPGSELHVFENPPRPSRLRPARGEPADTAFWGLAEPLLEEALADPARVFTARGTGLTAPTGPVRLMAAAIPGRARASYALLFVAPASSAASLRDGEAALDVVRKLLHAVIVAGGTLRARTLHAIHQAQLEWEQTVDALPDIVGLLDRRNKIMRVGRAVEKWSLGPVRGAIGRTVHELLHPHCGGTGCALALSLDAAVSSLDSLPTAKVEICDPVLQRDLAIVFTDITNAVSGSRRRRTNRAAVAISDMTTLRDVERALARNNQLLEDRVSERTADLLQANLTLRGEVVRRREAESALRDSQRELEKLSELLVSAQERERKRISLDLHDSVGQSLTAIKYLLEQGLVHAQRGHQTQPQRLVEHAVERVKQVMDDVRTISANLRPRLLDDLGAVSAVRCLCREWQEVYDHTHMSVDIAVDDSDIPASIVTPVYRGVQELLNNIAQHADASHIRVSIAVERGRLAVCVEDDGVGFNMPRGAAGGEGQVALRGLLGLRERAERSGGSCTVNTAPGRGTAVRLEWPLRLPAAMLEPSHALN